jgi:hypothetical protein
MSGAMTDWLNAERMRVQTPDGWTGPTKLVVCDTVHDFRPGIVLELPCRARPT